MTGLDSQHRHTHCAVSCVAHHEGHEPGDRSRLSRPQVEFDQMSPCSRSVNTELVGGLLDGGSFPKALGQCSYLRCTKSYVFRNGRHGDTPSFRSDLERVQASLDLRQWAILVRKLRD